MSKIKHLHKYILNHYVKCARRNYSNVNYSNLNENSVVFSGIQPTGAPHIGNYLGALKQWVDIQNEPCKKYFSIVDLHSLTAKRTEKKTTLKDDIFTTVACLLACGLDPNKCTIFQQSQIPEHAALAWILSTLSSYNKMRHLIHWKEKSKAHKSSSNVGLFTYPILQAADILLYKSTHVPVGEDQRQNIEVARDLARSFNSTYGQYFTLVEGVTNNSKRIKSFKNPILKMSKSDVNDRSRINLSDTPEDVTTKIQKSLTDSSSHISYDNIRRPGVSNLINIHSVLSETPVETIVENCEKNNVKIPEYKRVVMEVVLEFMGPIQSEYQRLLKDPEYVMKCLNEGSEAAHDDAATNWKEIKSIIGF